jgi:hypothetical protein
MMYIIVDNVKLVFLSYEQDWMNHQILDFTPLMTDLHLGRNWLMQMGSAALKFNITLQYCMSLSR